MTPGYFPDKYFTDAPGGGSDSYVFDTYFTHWGAVAPAVGVVTMTITETFPRMNIESLSPGMDIIDKMPRMDIE